MNKKITLKELQEYIISESKKLYQIESLKEEKFKLEKELLSLDEIEDNYVSSRLLDPVGLKLLRQNLIKKAAGWDFPELTQVISEKKYSDKANNFIGKEISHLEKDKDYSHDRATAAAINVAKGKGYKIPSLTNEIDKGAMDAAKKDIKGTGLSFKPLGQSEFEKNIDKKNLEKAMSPEKIK